MQQPWPYNVSFRDVLLHDLISFLVGILYLFTMVCVSTIIIAVKWFDAPPPKESPAEIFFGCLFISAVVFTTLRFRTARVSTILTKGEAVTAEVLRGLHYQTFTQIFLRYTLHGVATERKLWLPNTKQSRALIQAEQLTLAIDRESPDVIIVRDLYLPNDAAGHHR